MLRITQVSEDSDQVCLKVEGRVTGDWVSELDRTCGSCLSQRRHITLDVSDVTYIDRQGVETLKRILGENVRLRGASLLVQALLGRQMAGRIRQGKTI
jgi:anti-anti-sigma regulatory factor